MLRAAASYHAQQSRTPVARLPRAIYALKAAKSSLRIESGFRMAFNAAPRLNTTDAAQAHNVEQEWGQDAGLGDLSLHFACQPGPGGRQASAALTIKGSGPVVSMRGVSLLPGNTYQVYSLEKLEFSGVGASPSSIQLLIPDPLLVLPKGFAEFLRDRDWLPVFLLGKGMCGQAVCVVSPQGDVFAIKYTMCIPRSLLLPTCTFKPVCKRFRSICTRQEHHRLIRWWGNTCGTFEMQELPKDAMQKRKRQMLRMLNEVDVCKHLASIPSNELPFVVRVLDAGVIEVAKVGEEIGWQKMEVLPAGTMNQLRKLLARANASSARLESFLCNSAFSILTGFNSLHRKGIYQGDMHASQAVAVSSNGQLFLHIIDFGHARDESVPLDALHPCRYASVAGDVKALGVTLVLTATMKYGSQAEMQRTLSHAREELEALKLSEACVRFILSMLDDEPNRPSVDQLLNDPWVKTTPPFFLHNPPQVIAAPPQPAAPAPPRIARPAQPQQEEQVSTKTAPAEQEKERASSASQATAVLSDNVPARNQQLRTLTEITTPDELEGVRPQEETEQSADTEMEHTHSHSASHTASADDATSSSTASTTTQRRTKRKLDEMQDSSEHGSEESQDEDEKENKRGKWEPSVSL